MAGRHMSVLLLLPLLLHCIVPASAQAAASKTIPYGPMVMVTLILSLMAAALIVVAFVICHFTWLVEKRASQRRVLKMVAEPSTVPKKPTARVSKPHWPVPQPQPQPQPQQLPQKSNESVELINKNPASGQLQWPSQTSENTGLRHTGSQFLEFLSRKWQVSSHHPMQLTTFKPRQSSTAAVPVHVADQGPSQQETVHRVKADDLPTRMEEFFDVCETDVGQNDNLIAGRAALRGEADRYEVAMELRDTRRSRASTPGVSARDVELASDSDEEKRAGGAADTVRSGTYVEWYEEVSAAL